MIPPAAEDDPRCVHCGNTDLTWVTDPAPDLCAACASKGLWSVMWGPHRAEEYRALLLRLSEKRIKSE